MKYSLFVLHDFGLLRLRKIINIKKKCSLNVASKYESTQNRESRDTKSEHSRVKPTTTSDPSQTDAFECAVMSEGPCDVNWGGGGGTSAALGSSE